MKKLINSTRVFRVLELADLLPEAVRHDGIKLDPTKVTIDISGCGYTVEDLQKALFERFNIQVENRPSTPDPAAHHRHHALQGLAPVRRAHAHRARGHTPRRLVQTPEIPAFTRLRFLPRDAYYCGGELVQVFDERERVNRRLAGRIAADQIVPGPASRCSCRAADHARDRGLSRRLAPFAQAHGDARRGARGLRALHPRPQARRGSLATPPVLESVGADRPPYVVHGHARGLRSGATISRTAALPPFCVCVCGRRGVAPNEP